MKYKDFLKILTFREKLRFSAGLLLEKALRNANKFKELSDLRNIITNIEGLGFQVEFKEKEFKLHRKDIDLYLRKETSDIDVFNQVYLREEYLPLIDFAQINNIPVNTIIDAGSNIGLTSAKLLTYFPQSKMICIEPDGTNFYQLSKNLSQFQQKVILLPHALWHVKADLYLNSDFRDGREWGRNITVNNTQDKDNLSIRSITFHEIIERYQIEKIDILKIDIEGSEASIFKEDNDLSFLEITKIIAIEIHDEFNCRDAIYNILFAKNFILFNSGELTIGINGNLK